MQFASLFSSVWAIVAIILLFGGSIFIHELGHFLAAKRRGLYIQRFSIGFGPKLFAWKKDGIEYRISMLPFGGYVALPQLADMRGIEGQFDVEPDRLKPIGYADKMIVAVMGAVFNVFFALALALVIWKVGYPVNSIEQSTTIGYLQKSFEQEDGKEVESPAISAGLKLGDKILKIDGIAVENWTSVRTLLLTGIAREADGKAMTTFLIERDGREMTIAVHPLINKDTKFRHVGIGPAAPVIIAELFDNPNSPALKSGLQINDQILEVNGVAIHSREQLQSALIHPNIGKAINLLILREEQTITKSVDVVNAQYTKEGDTTPSIGIKSFYIKNFPIFPNPIKQIGIHINTTIRTLKALTDTKSQVSLKHMSGPVGIGRLLYQVTEIDFRIALWFTVLININLAIFNLLPIPVLDGGHMLFATISKLKNSPLPPNFIAGTQGVFMIALFGLMIYVTGHDLSRWLGPSKDSAPKVEYIDPIFPEKPADPAK